MTGDAARIVVVNKFLSPERDNLPSSGSIKFIHESITSDAIGRIVSGFHTLDHATYNETLGSSLQLLSRNVTRRRSSVAQVLYHLEVSHPMRIVYTPRGPVTGSRSERRGLASAGSPRWHGLWPLVWRFFVRELSSKYRQSLLGIFWAVIVPLVGIAMLLVLNNSGIIHIEGLDVPYPVFIILGISIWSLFSTTLTACTNSLVGATSLIAKIQFPRSALLLGHAGLGIVELLIRLPLIAVVLVIYGVRIDPFNALLALLSLIPLLLLAVGLGAILSVAAALFREVIFLLPMAIGVLLLLTPVMYPIREDTLLGRANLYNPLSHFTGSVRSALLFGELPGQPYWAFTAATAVLLIVASRLFQVAQTRIAERI